MHKKIKETVVYILLLLLSLQPIAFGEEKTIDIKKELEEVRQEQKKLHEELKMIKDLLLKGMGPAPTQTNILGVEFDLGDNPIIGNDSAPLVMVEFSDYQCSFCARYTNETYPEIFEKYIKTGKLRYAFIDKPLPSHDKANEAAEAAHCASEQGKFLEMHKGLLSDPESINDFSALATLINLDTIKFNSCMDTKKYSKKVSENLLLSNRLNMQGVPCFVIASRDPSNPQKVKGISYIRGAKPFDQFQKEIDQAFEKLGK
jgi:protein-disulfide isomerase